MQLEKLKGVGKITLQKLNALNIYTPSDLLYCLPKSYNIYELTTNYYQESATLKVTIGSKFFTKKLHSNLTMGLFYGFVADQKVKFIVFGQEFLRTQLTLNRQVVIYGSYNFNHDYFQVQKVFINGYVDRIEVKYKLKDLADATITKLVSQAFMSIDKFEDKLPTELVIKYRLLDYYNYLYKTHFPLNRKDLQEIKRRRTYEKFFWYYLAIETLILRQRSYLKEPKIFSLTEVKKFISALPFTLTSDQEMVVDLILNELQSSKRINRLIQGDVGCGKTIVAFIAAYATILAGYQVAFIAPTEILANQHFIKAKNLFSSCEIELLTANLSAKEKKRINEAITSGSSKFIVGTHALLQEGIVFQNLGLLIIDEQQRFGVEQRSKLLKKYPRIDALYFTATPIPRTLGLASYGDLDLSAIKTLPSNRKPVTTKVVTDDKLGEVCQFINKKIQAGEQVFIVVPLIEDENLLDLWDIKRAEAFFKMHLVGKLGYIHGKLKAKEKEELMREFKEHNFDVLIATTIVEVGIDIPNASILVLLNAERFGLSTCHQLRGRVGRGGLEAYFFLVSNSDNERLKILENNADGFALANEDFKLRGPGDYLGKEQSGFIKLFAGDVDYEMKVSEYAKADAKAFASQIYSVSEKSKYKDLLTWLETKENENN